MWFLECSSVPGGVFLVGFIGVFGPGLLLP